MDEFSGGRRAAASSESCVTAKVERDTPRPGTRQGAKGREGAQSPMQTNELSAADADGLLDALTGIVARAAGAIRALSHETVARRSKADMSPVTAADEASERIILEGLGTLIPSLPVVSEEAMARAAAPALGASFALVDPLDGTKEYLGGRDDFVVNLALITRGKAIAGIIAAPAQGLIWRGVVGHRAERLTIGDDGSTTGKAVAIHTRRMPDRDPLALTSRSHSNPATDAFIARLPGVRAESCGSALKFCKIAQGDADLYPRLGPTSEWDIAAGDALISAAGGSMTTPDGKALVYGRKAPNFLVPAFVAWGDPSAAQRF